MITISLCMIVKNEENILPVCLKSIDGIPDEIIIVDTGSADRTKEVAIELGAKQYDFAWTNDFSAARNYAFSKAGMEYLLWMDADDILLPRDREKFLALKQTLDPQTDVVMMHYNASLDETGRPTFTYLRERLLKRANNPLFQEPVHECIAVSGIIITSDIAITHNKNRNEENAVNTRNLEIYQSLLHKGVSLSPRGMYYYARELMDHKRLDCALTRFEEFLQTQNGWKEDNIGACLAMGRILYEQKQYEQSFMQLCRSFLYDAPHPEICCQIGYVMKALLNFEGAIHWFLTALQPLPAQSRGFTQPEYYGYVPALELAVLYYSQGDMQKSEQYNEIAATYKPDSETVAMNRGFYKGKKEAPA